MKNLFFAILIIYLGSCTREFTNDCDSNSINYKPVKAIFTSTRNGNNITFYNNSENAETIEWQFSDGTKSTEKFPQKTFLGDKIYTIKLIASRCGNNKKDSTSLNIDMKCSELAPTISYPASSNLNICNGGSLKLTASACAVGTILWSNGATTASIDVNTSGNYTARCQGSCQTASSAPVAITILPKPTIETAKGSRKSILKVYTHTLNGKINFISQTAKVDVLDHGFVYLAGSIDPNTSKDKVEISLGKKNGIQTFSFTDNLDNSNGTISYRAYIKLCDGKTIQYGEVQTTN